MVVPVGIKHSRSVPAEEGYLFREAAPLVDGNDGECATATGFPIDRNVFRICLLKSQSAVPLYGERVLADLDEVRVPGVL